MTAYYNEIDHHAASWLRELISLGLIADGEVDERSITDVRPDDLRGFTQCHFFAGIGGWSRALRLAGWPDDRLVWTGSCPCQPFSAAGEKRGSDDERHLWPAFFDLIRECRPAIVFGEQVAGSAGYAWWDHVAADLEGEAYAVAAADLGAHSVGAAHIRQRIYWLAYHHEVGRGIERQHWIRQDRHSHARIDADGRSKIVPVVHADRTRLEGWFDDAGQYAGQCAAGSPSAWDNVAWILCSDEKYRPIEPGIFPLVDGVPKGLVRGGDRSMAQDANESAEGRPMRLRGYGNAIVPELASAFIRAAS